MGGPSQASPEQADAGRETVLWRDLIVLLVGRFGAVAGISATARPADPLPLERRGIHPLRRTSIFSCCSTLLGLRGMYPGRCYRLMGVSLRAFLVRSHRHVSPSKRKVQEA